MKKSNLICCFALSLVAGGATAAGFVSQSVKGSNATMAAVNTTVNEETTTIYLELNSLQGWEDSNAKFAIWDMSSSSGKWAVDVNGSKFMTPVEIEGNVIPHLFQMTVDSNITSLIFSRQNPEVSPGVTATEPDWNRNWNQTYDLSYSEGQNGTIILGWVPETQYSTSENSTFSPVSDGFYIKGTFNEWSALSEYQMTWNPEGGEAGQYEYEDLIVEYNGEFKINKYERLRSTNTWYGSEILQSGEGQARTANQLKDNGGNIHANVPGFYSLYLKDSGGFKLFIPAINEEYSLKINDSEYELIQNPGSENEFYTVENIAFKKGDKVKLIVNEEEIVVPAKQVGNNNFAPSGDDVVATLGITSKVYVGVENKNYTVFCDGITLGDKGMSLNDNYVKLTKNSSATSQDEWMIEGLTVNNGDKIKFVNTSGVDYATVFSARGFKEGSHDEFEINEDGDILFKGEGPLTVDLFADFENSADLVYIQESGRGVKEAIEFAQYFNEQVGGICNPQGGTEAAQLQEVWAAAAESYASKSASTEGFAEILKSATASSSNEDLAKFAAKYDYVWGKYGESYSLANFAQRTISSSNSIKNINQTQIIIIATTVSVLSLAAFAAIILNKKKKAK